MITAWSGAAGSHKTVWAGSNPPLCGSPITTFRLSNSCSCDSPITISRFRFIRYIAIMDVLHIYRHCDVGSRSCIANAMLQEHNKPSQIYAPRGSSDAPHGYRELVLSSNEPPDPLWKRSKVEHICAPRHFQTSSPAGQQFQKKWTQSIGPMQAGNPRVRY